MKSAPVIIIFGISGDLASRKLLPALYHLMNHGYLDADTKIVGVSRHELTVDELLTKVELCILEKHGVCDPRGVEAMRQAMSIVILPEDSFAGLASSLDTFDKDVQRDRLFYLSIPPKAYESTTKRLAEAGLNDQRSRLLVEKPIGHDTASAQQLINTMGQYFEESQIYRIDHYLAKETAQNLLAFRRYNPIFSMLWGDHAIESIHVRASETIGVENRIDFYEHTGALRDVIQGHLLQILSLTMMDQPDEDSSEAIHEAKAVFLESLVPADPLSAIRGQYKGYLEEAHNADSIVETYARIELRSTLPQWDNTKIILETGKALAVKSNDITVQFHRKGEHEYNRLTFFLQPEEAIRLDLVVKKPGFDTQLQHTKLNFTYDNEFAAEDLNPDAYERVIMDAIRADQSLFASQREVIASWKAVEPLLKAWSQHGEGLYRYNKGIDLQNFT